MANDLTQWLIAAETKEWVGPIVVTADGTPVTTFEVTLTAPGVRPTVWQAADALGAARGILIGSGTTYPLTPGVKYTVWIRFTDTPEIPVQRCGQVKVY